MVITIDGYSWLGKSYIAKKLSMACGFRYLSTGMLVRYTAEKTADFIRQGHSFDFAIEKALCNAETSGIDSIILHGKLDDPETEKYLSEVEKSPNAINRLHAMTRQYSQGKNIILDGHYNFLLFPDAYKCFYFSSCKENRISLVQCVKKCSYEEAEHYIDFRDSFERITVLPESVDVIDPFSMSEQELLEYLKSNIVQTH